MGPGLRVGFQGLLHVEVFRQRLQDEFNIDAVVTPPKVPYTITWMAGKKNPSDENVTKVVEDLANWVSEVEHVRFAVQYGTIGTGLTVFTTLV